jgi:hypothetical protein
MDSSFSTGVPHPRLLAYGKVKPRNSLRGVFHIQFLTVLDAAKKPGVGTDAF